MHIGIAAAVLFGFAEGFVPGLQAHLLFFAPEVFLDNFNGVIEQDPRDAWMIVQRICGVCTTTHALSSVRAAESALNIDVPVNAQYIRNIILAAHTTHDHIVHFYQLSALDWVDITSALQADPTKASEISEDHGVLIIIAIMIGMLFVQPVMGLLSDRFGRRPFVLLGSVALFVLAIPAFILINSNVIGLIFAGLLMLAVILNCFTGVISLLQPARPGFQ